MKAIRIHGRGGPDNLVYEDVPQPGPGEVLVGVYATGVIVNELRWNETYETKAGFKCVLPIPGRDLSGVVVEVGPGVTDLTDEFIDYTTTRFEYVVHDVDLVFDLVGGDTLQRSWQVIKLGRTLISVVSPRPSFEGAKARDVHATWFVVEPNREQLIQIGELIDAGKLRPIIDAVFPLSQARQAYEEGMKGHTRGKVVLRVGD